MYDGSDGWYDHQMGLIVNPSAAVRMRRMKTVLEMRSKGAAAMAHASRFSSSRRGRKTTSR
jgi:hypothetical protein